VYLETATRRSFAGAIDWPGWCRSGRDDAQALEALAAYADRYRVVTAEAHVRFPAGAGRALEVVERWKGSATTDFGAPDAVLDRDHGPVAAKEAARLGTLLSASWRIFDRVVSAAPPELRKGPRGGGRDRDKVVEHLLDAEAAYARKLGVRLKAPPIHDATAVGAHRHALLEALRTSDPEDARGKGRWPARYAARRLTWHVLDHAWEIEDRIP
jgi:hypothetical protein